MLAFDEAEDLLVGGLVDLVALLAATSLLATCRIFLVPHRASGPQVAASVRLPMRRAIILIRVQGRHEEDLAALVAALLTQRLEIEDRACPVGSRQLALLIARLLPVEARVTIDHLVVHQLVVVATRRRHAMIRAGAHVMVRVGAKGRLAASVVQIQLVAAGGLLNDLAIVLFKQLALVFQAGKARDPVPGQEVVVLVPVVLDGRDRRALLLLVGVVVQHVCAVAVVTVAVHGDLAGELSQDALALPRLFLAQVHLTFDRLEDAADGGWVAAVHGHSVVEIVLMGGTPTAQLRDHLNRVRRLQFVVMVVGDVRRRDRVATLLLLPRVELRVLLSIWSGQG